MSFQEKYIFTPENATFFSSQFDILITGWKDLSSERCMHFQNNIPNFKGLKYSFDICENVEKLSFRIENSDGILIDEKQNLSLIPELYNLLLKSNFKGSNICIDITSLKQGILFLLIQIFINNVKPAQLFVAYTEPLEYKKRRDIHIGETEEYDLYDRIIGSSNGVPGFNKSRSSKKILLLAPIGFDSQRLQTIYESLKPDKLIPIVGFPSFVPGWNLTAIKMNYLILKSDDCFDFIRACEAASPFYLFDLLTEEFHRYNSQYDIYISPLGTRPHCLGAALFVAKNPSTYLIYDFPVEKKYRSERILKTNIYHLSKYIS